MKEIRYTNTNDEDAALRLGTMDDAKILGEKRAALLKPTEKLKFRYFVYRLAAIFLFIVALNFIPWNPEFILVIQYIATIVTALVGLRV